MLKALRSTGILIGAGVLVGAGAIVWMRLQPRNESAADSKGGSVTIDTRETPAPTADPLALHVTAPSSDAAQGAAQSNTTSGNGLDSGGESSGEHVAPGPTEFKQYEQYKNSAGALFGEIKPGNGDAVAEGKVVTVNYQGWLTDGTLFDATTGSNTFSFTEGEHRVIPGWEQALFGMKAGGKRRLIVPPAVGYGSQAHGPVPANSVLVFDVELISVK